MKDTHITEMDGKVISLIEVNWPSGGEAFKVGSPILATVGDSGHDDYGPGFAFPAGTVQFEGKEVWLWHYVVNDELDTITCINTHR